MTAKMPAWFLAHGAPLHLLGEQPVRKFWQQLPARLPAQPHAIICLSAHWLTETPCLTGMSPNPGIQHDFFGFPDQLYQIQWALQDNPQTDQWMLEKLSTLLPELELKPDYALDHGTWVPLINAWPEPDFPIYQLSLCPQKGAQWHIDLGKKLSSLRDEGVLIICSGGIVHNLRQIDWHANKGVSSKWSKQFMDAVESTIQQQDYDALCNPWTFPHGQDAVPTIEHYLPLLVMLGCGSGKPVETLYSDWEYGSLALHSYAVSAG
ncbi:MAG: dioxygenase [Gammaproteobacteria bacterium]|nr:MAG: dioxygenase [Gammaproteobacteria bacterium]